MAQVGRPLNVPCLPVQIRAGESPVPFRHRKCPGTVSYPGTARYALVPLAEKKNLFKTLTILKGCHRSAMMEGRERRKVKTGRKTMLQTLSKLSALSFSHPSRTNEALADELATRSGFLVSV